MNNSGRGNFVARTPLANKYLNEDTLFDSVTETFPYPCSDTAICQPYRFSLPAGSYLIELYGASGGSQYSVTNAKRDPKSATTTSEAVIQKWGGNALSKPLQSAAGAGGYVRGILRLKSLTKVFLYIGGQGEYANAGANPRGGYNGGGRGMRHSAEKMGGGGGGSTDLRIGIDDVWHRVMVAAGGGGADNSEGSLGQEDDGSGGCGGTTEGQGMWVDGQYDDEHIATQLKGFSFFQGEASQRDKGRNPNEYYSAVESSNMDRPGAGGGWFGGFARHHANAGAGGGSSFILHRLANIPSGDITMTNEEYNNPISKPYAFNRNSEYCFTDYAFVAGIRSGNGLARISFVGSLDYGCSFTRDLKLRHIVLAFAALGDVI